MFQRGISVAAHLKKFEENPNGPNSQDYMSLPIEDCSFRGNRTVSPQNSAGIQDSWASAFPPTTKSTAHEGCDTCGICSWATGSRTKRLTASHLGLEIIIKSRLYSSVDDGFHWCIVLSLPGLASANECRLTFMSAHVAKSRHRRAGTSSSFHFGCFTSVRRKTWRWFTRKKWFQPPVMVMEARFLGSRPSWD